MQAIYEAVLLVPTEPHQATLRLNRLFRADPHFITTFAQLMLEYYVRSQPSNAREYEEYNIMMLQLAALLNRFLGLALSSRGDVSTLNVEEIFGQMVRILAEDGISLACKKPLVPSLTSLIASVGLKGERLLDTLEGLVTSGAGSSVFVVFQALLDSNLYDSEKLRSIETTYRQLYWLANEELSELVRYHRQNRMEGDGALSPGDHFLQMLKDNEYILSIIIRIISLPYRKVKANNSQVALSELLARILMEGDLAVYLSRLLKIEEELLTTMGLNPFGLRLVVLCGLKKEQQVIVNHIKAECLWTLRLILSLTDKEFNIRHTDKLLMRELPSLAHLLLQQLLVCSNPEVMSQLKSELQTNFLLASIFELLAEVVRFRDLREVFEGLSVEQIIRLSLAHLSSGVDELQTFQNEPDNYTTLLLYALHRDDLNDGEQEQYEGTIGEFAVKRQIGGFLWAVGRSIEGFQSILIEVCLDVIKLECQCRPSRIPDYEAMFLQKYGLNPSILPTCKLSNSLLCLALLLERSDGQLQRRKGIKAILDTVRLEQLEPIELGRVYACLAMHCTYFHIPEIQNRYYYIIEEAIRAGRSQSALARLAYYFLEKVMTHNKEPEQSHLVFSQKLLNEIFAQLPEVTHIFACETIEQVLFSQEMLPLFNLDILCNCLQHLLAAFRLSFTSDCSHIQLSSKQLELYKNILQLGIKIAQKQQELPYPAYKDHLQQYHAATSRIISPSVINVVNAMVSSKTVDSEEEHLLFIFCQIACLLISSQSLREQEQLLLEKTALKCLNRQIQFENFLKKGTFQLLWHIVRVRGLLLGNSQLQTILEWMRRIYFTSETNLNRVCLILQQFYCMAAFSPFCTINLYVFFSPIAELLKHKLLDALFKITQLLHEISNEQDEDRRKINEISLNLRPQAEESFNPITVCRLYTLLLMDPKLDPASLRSIHQPMQKKACPLPAYDLGMQVLALRQLTKRSKKLGVVECFRFTTSLLHSHALPGSVPSTFATQQEKEIREMVQPLRPALANPDPYHSFAQLVDDLLHKHEVIFNDQGMPVQSMEVDIIDYLKSDLQLIRLVRKVCCVRRVNEQTRSIFRVHRE